MKKTLSTKELQKLVKEEMILLTELEGEEDEVNFGSVKPRRKGVVGSGNGGNGVPVGKLTGAEDPRPPVAKTDPSDEEEKKTKEKEKEKEKADKEAGVTTKKEAPIKDIINVEKGSLIRQIVYKAADESDVWIRVDVKELEPDMVESGWFAYGVQAFSNQGDAESNSRPTREKVEFKYQTDDTDPNDISSKPPGEQLKFVAGVYVKRVLVPRPDELLAIEPEPTAPKESIESGLESTILQEQDIEGDLPADFRLHAVGGKATEEWGKMSLSAKVAAYIHDLSNLPKIENEELRKRMWWPAMFALEPSERKDKIKIKTASGRTHDFGGFLGILKNQINKNVKPLNPFFVAGDKTINVIEDLINNGVIPQSLLGSGHDKARKKELSKTQLLRKHPWAEPPAWQWEKGLIEFYDIHVGGGEESNVHYATPCGRETSFEGAFSSAGGTFDIISDALDYASGLTATYAAVPMVTAGATSILGQGLDSNLARYSKEIKSLARDPNWKKRILNLFKILIKPVEKGVATATKYGTAAGGTAALGLAGAAGVAGGIGPGAALGSGISVFTYFTILQSRRAGVAGASVKAAAAVGGANFLYKFFAYDLEKLRLECIIERIIMGGVFGLGIAGLETGLRYRSQLKLARKTLGKNFAGTDPESFRAAMRTAVHIYKKNVLKGEAWLGAFKDKVSIPIQEAGAKVLEKLPTDESKAKAVAWFAKYLEKVNNKAFDIENPISFYKAGFSLRRELAQIIPDKMLRDEFFSATVGTLKIKWNEYINLFKNELTAELKILWTKMEKMHAAGAGAAKAAGANVDIVKTFVNEFIKHSVNKVRPLMKKSVEAEMAALRNVDDIVASINKHLTEGLGLKIDHVSAGPGYGALDVSVKSVGKAAAQRDLWSEAALRGKIEEVLTKVLSNPEKIKGFNLVDELEGVITNFIKNNPESRLAAQDIIKHKTFRLASDLGRQAKNLEDFGRAEWDAKIANLVRTQLTKLQNKTVGKLERTFKLHERSQDLKNLVEINLLAEINILEKIVSSADKITAIQKEAFEKAAGELRKILSDLVAQGKLGHDRTVAKMLKPGAKIGDSPSGFKNMSQRLISRLFYKGLGTSKMGRQIRVQVASTAGLAALGYGEAILYKDDLEKFWGKEPPPINDKKILAKIYLDIMLEKLKRGNTILLRSINTKKEKVSQILPLFDRITAISADDFNNKFNTVLGAAKPEGGKEKFFSISADIDLQYFLNHFIRPVAVGMINNHPDLFVEMKRVLADPKRSKRKFVDAFNEDVDDLIKRDENDIYKLIDFGIKNPNARKAISIQEQRSGWSLKDMEASELGIPGETTSYGTMPGIEIGAPGKGKGYNRRLTLDGKQLYPLGEPEAEGNRKIIKDYIKKTDFEGLKGLPEKLNKQAMFKLIQKESSFGPYQVATAESSKAAGLGQFLPGAISDLKTRGGMPNFDPFNAEMAIHGIAKFWKILFGYARDSKDPHIKNLWNSLEEDDKARIVLYSYQQGIGGGFWDPVKQILKKYPALETNMHELKEKYYKNRAEFYKESKADNFADYILYPRGGAPLVAPQPIPKPPKPLKGVVKEMKKLDLEKLVREVIKENSGQGYASYPYGSSVRGEEQPKEDYMEEWEAFSDELFRDTSCNTAIEVAKILVNDLDLFKDVLELISQNQSVGEEILQKRKEAKEKNRKQNTYV